MESLRPINTFFLIGVIAWILVVPAFAWDTGAHLGFNEIAVKALDNDMNTAFKTLSGQYNYAILDNSTLVPGYIVHEYKDEKTIKNWLIYGGESADYPLARVLNHFYNPELRGGLMLSYPAPVYADTLNTLPPIDNEPVTEKVNPYSWAWAKEYFRQAATSTEYNNDYYGQTWRAVGESMHMATDMFNPAHVRGDKHMLGDPLESVTDKSEVYKYEGGPVTPQVDFAAMQQGGDLQAFMIDAAIFTHDNFYSKDTIPDFSVTPYYEEGGYVVKTIDGISGIRMAAHPITHYYRQKIIRGEKGIYKESSELVWEEQFCLDNEVLKDQKRLLIPDSIQAATVVLRAAMPKFQLVGESVTVLQTTQASEGSCTVKVQARLTHLTDQVWTKPLNVNNGAYYQVNEGSWKDLPPSAYSHPSAGQTLITFTTPARDGDIINVKFNLGGYTINQATPPLSVSGCKKVTPLTTTLTRTPATTLTRAPTAIKTSTTVPTTLKPATKATASPNCFWCGEQAHGGILCSRNCQGVWDPLVNDYVVCRLPQGRSPECYCPCPS